MRFWRQGERTPTWWAAATLAPALFVLDLCGHVQREATDWKTWFFLATMGLGLGAGLWIWAWRPQTHMGPLLYWWPALTLAGDLMVAYPDSRSAATIGLGLYTMGLIVFAQMALSYPNGRLMPGLAAFFYIFIAGYAAQVIQNAYNLAVVDGRGCPYCPPPHERSWLFLAPPPFSSTGGTGAGRSRSSPSSRSAWRCSGSSSSGSRRADAGRSCRSRSGGL